MSGRLVERLAAFRGRRVTVLGEAMVDSYLYGSAERLSREAPVPIVAMAGRVDSPGGAANAAVNVAALGGEVQLLSVCGRDEAGSRLRATLESWGISDEHMLGLADRDTLAKERVLAGGQMLVRLDSGSTDAIGAEAEEALIKRLLELHRTSEAVLVSDYGYGVVTARIRSVLAELQRKDGRVLVVDARDLTGYRRVRPTAVKPNYQEAIRLLGEPEKRSPRARSLQIGASGGDLLEKTGARIVAITLDADGAFIFEQGQPFYRTYSRPRSHSRAAGAGDTFAAALTLALAAHASTPEAAELASAAASVVVAKEGTAACSADELEQSLTTVGKRLVEPDRIAARAAFYRQQGRRVVFTNGCFDILHRGHITYLNRAKALGDVLIVGVNSDDSTRRLKGPTRPINGLDDRLHVLEALSCVDHVVPFEEDTPERLVKVIRPDVFAKGGDYTRETLPEAALVESLGGTVQILPFVEDHSTTGIIARVRSSEETDALAAAGTGRGG